MLKLIGTSNLFTNIRLSTPPPEFTNAQCCSVFYQLFTSLLDYYLKGGPFEFGVCGGGVELCFMWCSILVHPVLLCYFHIGTKASQGRTFFSLWMKGQYLFFCCNVHEKYILFHVIVQSYKMMIIILKNIVFSRNCAFGRQWRRSDHRWWLC